MTVSFLGAISRITETRQQAVTASTIDELLKSLLQKYGLPWQEQVFNGARLTDGVVVMLNGINIHQIQGLATPLSMGDDIAIFPMFDGG